MKKIYLLRIFLLIGLFITLVSCEKESFVNDDLSESGLSTSTKAGVDRVLHGTETTVGNGYIHSWISYDKFNTPLEIGIEMTPEVLDDLPQNSNFAKEAIIPLDEEMQLVTPFDHILLDWNPAGYSNIDAFKPAHFHFYFFLISNDERDEIPAWSEDNDEKFSHYPPKTDMALDYEPFEKEVGAFERIGRVWSSVNLDKSSSIDQTLALGTYNGRFIFIDPVLTLDYIKTGLPIRSSISQPLHLPNNKRHPREYNFYINEKGNYCISLGNFIAR